MQNDHIANPGLQYVLISAGDYQPKYAVILYVLLFYLTLLIVITIDIDYGMILVSQLWHKTAA